MKKTPICLQKYYFKRNRSLLRLSGGDGRKLLNIFELVVNASNEDEISLQMIWFFLSNKTLFYMIKPANNIMT
jgi:putative ATPase